MNDQTTMLGSEESGNSAESTASEDGGSESHGSDFLSALNEDNQKTVEAKGWTDPNKVVESYRQLESKLGENLSVPGDDADKEAWDKFYDRVGRPEKADAYEFAMPDGLDENFAYDADSAGKFKQWAHEAGLNARQAQTLHDRFVQDMNGGFVATIGELREAGESAHKAITKEWGDEKSDMYKRNQELADRAIRELGGDELVEEFKRSGVMRSDGAVTFPKIAFAMAKVGRELFSEDNVFSAQARNSNPFAKETENVTEQGRILRDDPELAKSLISSSGREKDFPTTMRTVK